MGRGDSESWARAAIVVGRMPPEQPINAFKAEEAT